MREHQDYREVKRRLTKAFASLRKQGVFARQNFKCCQGCALNAIPADTETYVFYHAQDEDDLKDTGTVHISWGVQPGHGRRIRAELQAVGLKAEWTGALDRRISVSLGAQ